MDLILAADRNWGIGKDNGLLVSIPEDMKFFRKTTAGKTVVMGRKTFESLPSGALPKRRNIVLSRKDFSAENTEHAGSIGEVASLIRGSEDDVFIIGGAEIYRLFLPYCDKVYVTRIDHEYDADTFFVDLDSMKDFELIEESEIKEYNNVGYRFCTYRNLNKKEIEFDKNLNKMEENFMAENTFLVEVSARHVHLTQEDVERLFGEGKTLTYVRDLSQPGQFVSEERVDIVGPKRTLSNVVILGPVRKESQVEVSLTDCFTLGQVAPVRESGDLDGSAPITLKGPAGEITLEQGLIVAKRHIHMTPEDAEKFGVSDKQIVKVRVDTDRPLIFDDVVVRVSPNYALAMHIDTDEANAALVGRAGCQGYIVD